MSEYLAQKHALYAQVGRLSRALGQQTRLEIIEILAQAPRSVETIASLLQTDIRSVSQHLQVLVECGLLTVERKGRFRWYAVRCQEVLQLAVLLRTTAESLLGVPQTDVKDELTLSEGLSLAQQGKLQLIDVRPLEEFQSGHLAGALSMPLASLSETITKLDSETPAAAYCRSPYCFLARQAQEIFAKHGKTLYVLSDGVQDWKASSPELLTVSTDSEES